MRHENLNPFVGCTVDSPNVYVLTRFCERGSLEDLLSNDDIKMDMVFKISFAMDIANVSKVTAGYTTLDYYRV